MKQQPLVSVIITAYNRTEFLKAAIESVKNQSYQNIEILVIDDGSATDAIEQLCNVIGGVKYLRKENGGISSSRNFGIEAAQGDYLAFLDDDDTFKPHRIEVQLEAFKAFPGIGLVHSAAEVIDQKGETTGQIIGASKEKAHLRSGNVFWNALGTWLPKAPTVLIKREALADLRFNEKLSAGEDADFYQRFFYYNRVRYIEEPLAHYREYDDPHRLSKNAKRYLGLSQEMFSSFKTMGISNPFTLRRIARKLAQMEARNYAAVYPEKSPLFPYWKLRLFPISCIKQYISDQ